MKIKKRKVESVIGVLVIWVSLIFLVFQVPRMTLPKEIDLNQMSRADVQNIVRLRDVERFFLPKIIELSGDLLKVPNYISSVMKPFTDKVLYENTALAYKYSAVELTHVSDSVSIHIDRAVTIQRISDLLLAGKAKTVTEAVKLIKAGYVKEDPSKWNSLPTLHI